MKIYINLPIPNQFVSLTQIDTMTINFSHGFEYKNVRYGWYKKELYRLPYIANSGRSYSILHIQPKTIKGKSSNTVLYRCQRDWLTSKRIESLTTDVKGWKVDKVDCEECPF